MNITVRYNSIIPSNSCQIFFPWGVEYVRGYRLTLGWQTADPCSGKWELISFEVRSTGGIATFHYWPRPAFDSIASIAARDTAQFLAAVGNQTGKWMQLLDSGHVQRPTDREPLEKIHDMLVQHAIKSVGGGGAFYAPFETIVVGSWPGSIHGMYESSLQLFQVIRFPWGNEVFPAARLHVGSRTSCPLFGEWELVNLGTGDGRLTFRKVAP